MPASANISFRLVCFLNRFQIQSVVFHLTRYLHLVGNVGFHAVKITCQLINLVVALTDEYRRGAVLDALLGTVPRFLLRIRFEAQQRRVTDPPVIAPAEASVAEATAVKISFVIPCIILF